MRFFYFTILLCFPYLAGAQDCTNLTIDNGYPILVNPTCGENNGSIEIQATGTGTVEYSINGGPYSTNSLFQNLSEGVYNITYRDDVCAEKLLETSLDSSTPIVLNDPNVTAASCGNDDGRIVVNATGEGLTYQLNDGTPTTNNVFTNLASGIYTITIYDTNDCTRSQSVNVPSGTLSLNGIQVVHSSCASPSGEININATSTNGSAITYTLLQNGTVISSNSTGNFTNLSNGTYQIEIESDGCTINRNRTIRGRIDAEVINLTTTDCTSSAGSFEIQVNEAGSYEFSVNEGGWTTTTVFSNLAPGTYDIRIRNTNTSCVDNRLSAVIDVNQTISNENVTVTDANCNADDGEIQASASSSGTITFTLYDANGAMISSNQVGIFSNLSVGDYSVGFEDSNGCTLGPINAPIVEQNDVDENATISTTNSDCNTPNGSIGISATATSGINTYTLDGAETNSSGQFLNVAAGQHTITVLSNQGCSREFAVAVPENNTINVLALVPTQPTTQCSGDGEIYIQAEGINPTFSLSGNDGSFQPGNANGEYTFTGLNGGEFTIYIRDDEGCEKTTFIELSAGFSIQDVIIQPATCDLDNATIEIVASGNELEFKLDDGEYQTSNLFENVSAGTHTVYVNDENGCELEQEISIANEGSVAIDDAIIVGGSCGEENASVEIIASPLEDITGYSIDGNSFQTDSLFTNVSSGDLTIFAQDRFGCIDSLLVTIPQTTIPVLSAEISPSVCNENNGSITLSVEGGVGQPLISFNNSTLSENLIYSNLSPGDYNVRVVDEAGCELEEDFTIELFCEPLFPNSFTPNADGTNDVMKLIYYLPLEIKEFTVHNQWGELLHERANFFSTEEDNWWHGDSQPQGTYLIHAVYTFEGEEKTYSGSVQLIR